jgi:hypothetical protein
MALAEVRNSRLIQPILTVYRRVRILILSRTPWSVMYGGYRVLRRFPRLYFLLRALVMNEIGGPAK